MSTITKRKGVFLTYAEKRRIEDAVRAAWNGNGYQDGWTDQRVAEDLAPRIGKAIHRDSVATVRHAIGLKLATWSQGKPSVRRYRVRKDSLALINRLLLDHEGCVIFKMGEDVKITPLMGQAKG